MEVDRAAKASGGARLLCVALTILALVQFAIGFDGLTQRHDAARDLWIRWAGQQYVFHRQNPYDVQQSVWAAQTDGPEAEASRGLNPSLAPIPGIGAAGIVGDPPWSFVSGMILYPPWWTYARYHFAALCGVALVIIGWSASGSVDRGDRRGRWLVVAAALGPASLCTALGVGQVVILVVALLWLAKEMSERGKRFTAGVLIGIANLKPSIAGPFLLVAVAKRDIRGIAGASAYLIVASGITWWATGTDPITMTRQMLWGAPLLAERGYGVLRAVAHQSGEAGGGMVGTVAVVVAAIGLGVMVALRERSYAVHFAIAAVVARSFTYHRGYDNAMLVFLLVPLGALAWRRRGWTWVPFGLVGISLWAPTRFTNALEIQVAQHLIWAIGLVSFIAMTSPAESPMRTSVRPRADHRPRCFSTRPRVG